jgi:hypothetical protein
VIRIRNGEGKKFEEYGEWAVLQKAVAIEQATPMATCRREAAEERVTTGD